MSLSGKGMSRSQVIEKGKKQACTDALKRALKVSNTKIFLVLKKKIYYSPMTEHQ
jgi:recombination DNA repair RAD52 pathway protein